jgi:23S rRNA (adenine2503-C2)-methyltransferase
MEKLPVLRLTSGEFVKKAAAVLGKGSDHAKKFYKYFLREGDGLLGFNQNEPQSKNIFEELKRLMTVPEFTLVKSEVSLETEKYVLKFSDGLIAELVVIPMKTGLTLCVSSQVGCKMACAFCETGRMGKLRDLKADEILTQAFFAQNILKKPIKNIVFMGMGEPFDNYEELKIALNVLIDPHGFNFTPSKITVSTSGIIPRIYDFIEFGKKGVKLAVSINGSNPLNRQQVMPITRKYSMEALHVALVNFTKNTGQKIFAEYVMIEGLNDELVNAQELALYLQKIPSLINLIPYNAQSHDRFAPPRQEVICAFQNELKNQGYQVYVRKNKGDQIMAACGQLGQLELKKSVLLKPL